MTFFMNVNWSLDCRLNRQSTVLLVQGETRGLETRAQSERERERVRDFVKQWIDLQVAPSADC